MCDVPSWITKGKTVFFLTDKDVKRHRIDFVDATGHTAIDSVFNDPGGRHGEGLHAKTPKEVKEAIESGKMNKIVEVGSLTIMGGNWNIPASKVSDLYIEKKSVVTMPNLRVIVNELDLLKGSTLNAPLLKEVGDPSRIEGKLNAPKYKRG